MKPFASARSNTAGTRGLKSLATVLAALTFCLGASAQGAAPAAAQGTTAAAQTPAKVRTLAVAPVDVPPALLATLNAPAEREALRLFTDIVHREVIAGLNRSGTFQIVQRQDLSKIIAEQDLGQSGNVDPQTAARIGGLIGAEVLATIDLIQFDYMQRQTHAAAINRDIVTVSLNATANMTLLDTTTGALLASTTGEGKAVETKQYFIGSNQQGDSSRVPVTDAARQTADNIVKALTAELFPARVIAVTGNQITINRGTGYFKNGDVVDIIQYGAELRDPDTGRSLGREEVLIGQGKVLRVTAQATTVSLTENNGVQAGQVVVKQQ